jgi:hypothetical protein
MSRRALDRVVADWTRPGDVVVDVGAVGGLPADGTLFVVREGLSPERMGRLAEALASVRTTDGRPVILLSVVPFEPGAFGEGWSVGQVVERGRRFGPPLEVTIVTSVAEGRRQRTP